MSLVKTGGYYRDISDVKLVVLCMEVSPISKGTVVQCAFYGTHTIRATGTVVCNLHSQGGLYSGLVFIL